MKNVFYIIYSSYQLQKDYLQIVWQKNIN